MFETIMQALTVLITVTIAYMTFSLVTATKGSAGIGAFLELDWILENTPAQVSYLMFVIQTFIVTAASAFAFRVSNHVILTLDILYFISILLLILYHNLKEAGNLLIQEI